MAEKRMYKPGSKHKRFRPDGRMSENRHAWLRTVMGQMILMVYPENWNSDNGLEDNEPEAGFEKEWEVGDSVVLLIPQQYRKPLRLSFTAMTSLELEATRQFFNMIFDLAEPICKKRDEVAANAFAEGDDSFIRFYRPVPQLVVRERSSGENGQGVHDGPDDIPHGTGGDGGSDGGVRGDGNELADGEPEEGRTQDDEQAAD